MTVTYSLNVANTRLNGFAKLLTRWRGSIYKLLYREMIIFCILYYSLSILYRYILQTEQRRTFEKVVIYCEQFSKLIPLSFILGFYVSIVVTRWWSQYCAIPWPDNLLMMITGFVQDKEDGQSRLVRRTLARYLLMLLAITFQSISISVRRRFPTEEHLVEAGIMTKEEKVAYDKITGTHGKWWVPATWFTNLAIRARQEGRIKDDILLKHMFEEFYKFRGLLGDLFAYDWISIPLVYTQAVTIAVYTYFASVVMARQYLDPTLGYSGHDVDLYIPVFTLLEFFFFMGWLKVAEQLINPFGEDDDDFELNWILDRNLVVSIIIADQMHNQIPKMAKDNFWDDSSPSLPYTKSSAGLRSQPYLGSAMNLDINPEEFIPPLETIMEDEIDEGKYRNYQHFQPNQNGDLVNLNFSTYDPSFLSSSRPESSISQSALNLLPESLGSRIMNMIIGQSNDNLHNRSQVKKSQDRLNVPSNANPKSLLTPFIMRSPRTRKISSPHGLKPSISSSFITKAANDEFSLRKTSDSATPKINRKHNLNGLDFNDHHSMVVDLSDQLNEPRLMAQSHQLSENLRLNKSRPISSSVDETALGYKYPLSSMLPNQGIPNEDETNSMNVAQSDLYLDSEPGFYGQSSLENFGSAYSTRHQTPSASIDIEFDETKSLTGGSMILKRAEIAYLKPEATSVLQRNINNPKSSTDSVQSSSDDNGEHSDSNQDTITSISQLLPKDVSEGITSIG